MQYAFYRFAIQLLQYIKNIKQKKAEIMNKNKQLAINLFSQITTFFITLGISFFLSPFIVKHIGVEANGFVSLGNNFVGYAAILSTAINSMASRFITIYYVKKDYKTSNEYFSSVFFANVILSLVLLIPSIILVLFIEQIINVPSGLVTDVKILWSFIFLNFIISLLASVFSVSTFATNKLYLSSIRNIISQFIRVAVLVISYTFFPKYIWYIGLASILQNIYTSFTNYQYTKKLTPELHIKREFLKREKINNVLSSGIWNSINRLGSVLLESLDLLIANIFIGSAEMGILSVAKTIPSMITNLIGTTIGVFMPTLTIDYANSDKKALVKNMKMSMKITGLFTCVPIAVLVILGEAFYSLWQPTLNSRKLQILAVLTVSGVLISGCFNVIFNIFTVANKVKLPALIQVGTGALNTVIVLIIVNISDLGIYAVAGVSSILCIIKNLLIIVPYGCKCIDIKSTTFYPPLIRCLASTAVTIGIGLIIIRYINIQNWFIMILSAIVFVIIGLLSYLIICTNKEERQYMLNIFKKIIRKKEVHK